MRHLKSLWAIILNTLFPPVCVSCKKEGVFLCEECLKGLDKKKIRKGFWKTGGSEQEFKYLDGVIYALDYAKNPTIQLAIKQLKYRFTEELADTFADLMTEKIKELGMIRNRKIILIPVPLHKKRLNYRGFNQAEVVARAVEHRLQGKARVLSVLERIRHTDQQAKLSKKERHKNLEDAFYVNTKFVHEQKICSKNGIAAKDPVIFIVDDVCTTGATLEQCAKTLKDAGLPKVYGFVIARAFA